MTKHYDQAYFDRWYRDPALRDTAIGGGARLARKVALAVATAEYHLERPIRSVLDIGCGEGAWRAPLLKLRPKQQRIRDRPPWHPAQPAPGPLRRLRVPATLRTGRPAGLQRRAALPADTRTRPRPPGVGRAVWGRRVPGNIYPRRRHRRRYRRFHGATGEVLSRALRPDRVGTAGIEPLAGTGLVHRHRCTGAS